MGLNRRKKNSNKGQKSEVAKLANKTVENERFFGVIQTGRFVDKWCQVWKFTG